MSTEGTAGDNNKGQPTAGDNNQCTSNSRQQQHEQPDAQELVRMAATRVAPLHVQASHSSGCATASGELLVAFDYVWEGVVGG